MEFKDFLDVLSRVGPIITQIGIPGLLAVVLYFVDKERRRLLSVIEAQNERMTEAMGSANHGASRTRDALSTISMVLNSLRDLVLVLVSRGSHDRLPPLLRMPKEESEDDPEGDAK